MKQEDTKRAIRVTSWGTRGSIPVSGPQFGYHGGSTTCVELELLGARHEETPRRIIIDCGTGLAELGKHRGGELRDALMLQTHMHWDHVQGFPFFAPLFSPDAHFRFLSVEREGEGLREVLSRQMTRPTFPVGLDIIPARLEFDTIPERGELELGELTLRWLEMHHPSGSTAYRFEYAGTSFVFTGDVEVRQADCQLELEEFAHRTDVLMMDAQYLPEEYPSRVGFGHSTPLDAVEVAHRSKARHLLMTHHDPTHDDLKLGRKLQLARDYARRELTVDNARDRMVITLERRESTGELLAPVTQLGTLEGVAS